MLIHNRDAMHIGIKNRLIISNTCKTIRFS